MRVVVPILLWLWVVTRKKTGEPYPKHPYRRGPVTTTANRQLTGRVRLRHRLETSEIYHGRLATKMPKSV